LSQLQPIFAAQVFGMLFDGEQFADQQKSLVCDLGGQIAGVDELSPGVGPLNSRGLIANRW
jgi:hypothetical protein